MILPGKGTGERKSLQEYSQSLWGSKSWDRSAQTNTGLGSNPPLSLAPRRQQGGEGGRIQCCG